ncbi:carboxymuconolactone decarboxylase family protein [Actinoplanes sp. GCM10030250]|uniref:carboxymuconolactone decarboxylase family protein n=1 Tax=Actinoplanes sp. GCM10030250 TaxID=3273376 RepID=UPI00360942BD
MPEPYRYISPDPVASATGTPALVFAQSRRELGAPFAPHLMAAPDLHAATWSLLRESMLAGAAPRARKEAVALAVAVANRCPFCIDAHGVLLHATGSHRLARAVLRGEPPDDPADAALIGWATGSRPFPAGAAPLAGGAAPLPGGAASLPGGAASLPGGAAPSPAGAVPFPAGETAEFVGTVLVNHFINRMVDALRPGSILPSLPGPAGDVVVSPLRRLAGAALSRRVRRPVRPGDSLRLLGRAAAGGSPAWARDNPFIGTAYAAFRTAAHRGGDLLSEDAREVVAGVVEGWDGGHPAIGSDWPGRLLGDVELEERPAVRLVLLAAIAPYRLTDVAVGAWRGGVEQGEDGRLVRLLAFGAITAVDKIAAGLAVGGEPQPCETARQRSA